MSPRTPTSSPNVRLALLAGTALALGCSADAWAPLPPGMPPEEIYELAIEPILADKCADCHDSRRAPPWYAAMPVMGELVTRDIEFGRQRLELSTPYPFSNGEEPGRPAYLYALRSAILDDTMPPTQYALLHPLTLLSAAEKERILAWIERALVVEVPEPSDHRSLVEATRTILANRCARCHRSDVDETMNGEFSFLTDLELLRDSTEYVDLDSPLDSEILVRIFDDSDPMPPSRHDSLSDWEQSTLREWIEAGAPLGPSG